MRVSSDGLQTKNRLTDPGRMAASLSTRRYALISFAGLIAFLLFWQVVALVGTVDARFLPSPVQVARTLFSLLGSPAFMLDIAVSVLRVMAGFFLAALVAVPLGVYMGSFRPLEAALAPLVGFVRYLPVPAFLPLCILWFGVGEAEKIAVIFIGTFFQLNLMVMDKVATVPVEFIEIGRTSGLSAGESARRIVAPAILPAILDDLRICAGWAWSYLVVAEIVAAERGLGFLIMEGQRYLRTDRVMAGMLVIGLLGILLDFAFKALRRSLVPWATSAASP